MSKLFSECFNCIIDSFYRIKYQINKYLKERKRKKEYFSAYLFNNEEHPNISEYKIVKEINDDTNINVNDIKKEIGQVEFDDDEDDEEKKEKINDDSSEEEEREDIEDLKKTILNNPDI